MRSKIKVAGCAIQGRSHARQGVVCQDRVFTRRYADRRFAVAALADGAGSCRLSHIGAECAVSVVGDLVYENFSAYLQDPIRASTEILARLQADLKTRALQDKADLMDYASTLLFACIQRRRKTVHYLAGHLGDGVIAILENRMIKVLSHPEQGEFAGTTYFTTTPGAARYLRIYKGVVRGDAGFLLASDGAAEVLYRRRDRALAPACTNLLGWFDRLPQRKVAEAIQGNVANLLREATLDDCSLAILRVVGQPRFI
jgi:hypothetical protein